jgi:hypothetical protein
MAIDVKQLDIRQQNRAVESVLEATENPRHRYLLESYLRHRYLESAGRYEEILEPELTVDDPVTASRSSGGRASSWRAASR